MNSFSTAILNIRRSPYQSLAAILLLSVTFFVAYVFSLFVLVSEKVLQYFETRPQVLAFFLLEADTEDIDALTNQLKAESFVTEVKVVSQEEALKLHQEQNKEDPLLLELVTSQMLPASIEVSTSTLNDLVRAKDILEADSSIDEVVLQQDILESLEKWTSTIRWIGLGATTILGITSVLLMMVVIGMKVVIKRPAINIMRIIGATKWYIRSPFVFEGLLYGLLSSLIGWGITGGALLYLTPNIKNFLGPIPLFPIDPAFFAVQISVGTLAGMFLGAVAGSLAVGRVMRK